MSRASDTLWINIPSYIVPQNATSMLISDSNNTTITLPVVSSQNTNLTIVNQGTTQTVINDNSNNHVLTLLPGYTCILNPLIAGAGNSTGSWFSLGVFNNNTDNVELYPSPSLQNIILDFNDSACDIISSASSESSPGTAFNAWTIYNSPWQTSTGSGLNSWVQVKFPFPFRLRGLTYTGVSAANENPQNWNLQGSNDGITFTTLLSGQAPFNVNPQSITVANPLNLSFSYYRLNILTITSGGTTASVTFVGLYS